MIEPERLIQSTGNEPAADLLRSALSDRAPDGAKARALEALGLGTPDTAPMQGEHAKRSTGLVFPAKASERTKKQRQKQTAEVVPLFQSVLAEKEAPSALSRQGRAGFNVFLGLQAAAMILFLLSSPGQEPGPLSRDKSASRGRSGIDIDMMAEPGASRKSTQPQAEAKAEGEPKAAAKPIANAKAPAMQAEELPSGVSVKEVETPVQEANAPSVAAEEPPKARTPSHEAAPQVTIPIEVLTRPKRIGGRDPQYTRAAREARVEGTAIVQCEIMTNGTPRDCRVLRSLPHMEEELLAAAQTWRFTPATAEGRPISMRASFAITLVLPKN